MAFERPLVLLVPSSVSVKARGALTDWSVITARTPFTLGDSGEKNDNYAESTAMRVNQNLWKCSASRQIILCTHPETFLQVLVCTKRFQRHREVCTYGFLAFVAMMDGKAAERLHAVIKTQNGKYNIFNYTIIKNGRENYSTVLKKMTQHLWWRRMECYWIQCLYHNLKLWFQYSINS